MKTTARKLRVKLRGQKTMKEKLKGKGARIMNCEGMEFVLGDDGKVRDENG